MRLDQPQRVISTLTGKLSRITMFGFLYLLVHPVTSPTTLGGVLSQIYTSHGSGAEQLGGVVVTQCLKDMLVFRRNAKWLSILWRISSNYILNMCLLATSHNMRPNRESITSLRDQSG
jgi:hypothetical protein